MVLGAKVRHNTRQLLGHIKGHLYGQGGRRVSGIFARCWTKAEAPCLGFRFRPRRLDFLQAQETRTP
jgi:hypothetical protein